MMHALPEMEAKKIVFHHCNGKPFLTKKLISSTPSKTQLQVLVAHMSNLAKQLQLTSFHLCEAELRMKQQKYFHCNNAIYLGELDDVYSQCRHPFYFAEKGKLKA